MMDALESIIINPNDVAKNTIIWLHGLGADGHDFVPIASQLKLPAQFAFRFIFPHAPLKSVTINQGYLMRAWYDIYGFNRETKVDRVGIEQTSAAIQALIEQEIAHGIPSQNIFLGGFSQGAAVALTVGLTFSRPLGGIIALSGYLPLLEEVMVKKSLTNARIPIFLAHGKEDSVISLSHAEELYQTLTKHHFQVSWHCYAMAHTVSAQEIDDLQQWLCQVKKKVEAS